MPYLVVGLCIEKLAGRDNFCHNLLVLVMLFLDFLCHLLCNLLLLRRMVKDGRSVLSTDIRALIYVYCMLIDALNNDEYLY